MSPVTARVGVVGEGAMGRGSAQIAMQAGSIVQLFDVKAQASEAVRKSITAHWDRMCEKGRIDALQAADFKHRLRSAGSIAGLTRCSTCRRSMAIRATTPARGCGVAAPLA